MESNKEIATPTDLTDLAQNVAKEARVNDTIINLLNMGSLDNWNGVCMLPKKLLELKETSSIFGNEKNLKRLMLASIFARAASNFADWLGDKPKLTELNLPEKTKQQLLELALLLYSYPKGIELTNERVTFQIQEGELPKLKDFFNPFGNVEESLEKLGFEHNSEGGVWVLATTPAGLQEKTREILGIQKP